MARKIIVFGATGNTGIKICEELTILEMEHSAFVRNGSEEKLTTELTNIIGGDVLKKIDVENAIKGEAFTDIIIALGSRDLKAGNIRSIGTNNIVEVLIESSQKTKLHVISAHGVRESWSSLKWYEKWISKLFLSKTMNDHELQENIVVSNPGGYHIIRPVALKNAPATGNVHSLHQGPLPNGDISRADVATFLVRSMLSEKVGCSSICRGSKY